MSESTKSTDYRAKRAEYNVLDIPEYWIWDPLKEKMTVGTLLEGWYEAAEFAEETPIESPLFSELQVTNQQILNP